MTRGRDDEEVLRSSALKNAHSILAARQRVEDQLRRQSERLEVTLTSIHDAVITTDVDGRIISINTMAESLTGWPGSDARGRPLETVFRAVDEDTRKPVPSLANRAVAEAEPIAGIGLVLMARNGDEITIEGSAAPIREGDGPISGAVLVFREIGERRRAEEAVARLAAIVESSQDAIISKSVDGHILSWNAGAERLFGYRAGEIIGRSIMVLVPSRRRQEELEIMERLRRGERLQVLETERISKSGVAIDVALSISPLYDRLGRLVGASSIVRDITERRRSELALRRSETQFRQLADALPQIVWTAKPDGRIDYCNQRWYELTGVPEGEGAFEWDPFLHPADAGRCRAEYAASVESARPYQIEVRFRDRASGGFRWFLGRAFPVRDEGRVVRWFGTWTDIDRTKRSAETNRFLIEATADVLGQDDVETILRRIATLAVPLFADWSTVHLMDPDRSIRWVAVNGSGDDAEALLRSSPPVPPDRHLERGPVNALRTGAIDWAATVTDEILTACAGGRHLDFLRSLDLRSVITIPIRAGSTVLGAITFATAESGRVYGTEAVVAMDDLARRVGIAVENARLVAALQAGDRRKDEFLAMLAHELRNPLAPIRNAARILRIKAPPIPEVEWARDVIDRQVRQMARLVDDLMDVSRITRGNIELRRERIDLAAAVGGAVEASRPLIERRSHRLVVTLPDEPILLDADLTRLSQVLMNLLNNAAKYTDPGGNIALVASAEEGWAVVRVRDDGIGIPAEMLPQIFEMFTQVDQSLERSQGGLGIGLTLVKLLIELHGGRVDVRSAGQGMGSEFSIWLPRAGGPAGEER